ncbi:hypothetical protein K7432_004017 [Basidiobolus ranarum]|uniref:Uncharacterized protein n=1 Tax=Basidiobolus ranarum TaxID=34480 RepID=A0ABR2WYU7_9FUNG
MSLYKLVGILCSASLIYAAPYGNAEKTLNRIKTIVVFGDSYSDTGNVFKLTNKTYPPPYYYDGHFSNGRMWPEYLQEITHWKVINYAYGGATVNNKVIQGYTGPGNDIPVPSITDQIETHKNFLTSNPNESNPSSTLYVIEPAGNDYFYGGLSILPQSVAMNIYKASQVLFEPPFSGEHFLYFNVALDHLPYYLDNSNVTVRNHARNDRITHNKVLNDLVRSNSRVKGKVFDLNRFLQKELITPKYVDPEIPCIKDSSTPNGAPEICENPEKKVFWDLYHPTTTAHQMMAKAIINTIAH